MRSDIKRINTSELVAVFSAWPPDRQIQAIAAGMQRVYEDLTHDEKLAEVMMRRFEYSELDYLVDEL